MRPQRLTAPAALLLAITMVTPAAFAQSRGNERQRRPSDRPARTAVSGDRNRDTGRTGAREGVAIPRSEMRVESSRGNGNGQGGGMPATRAVQPSRGNGNGQGGGMPATRGYGTTQYDRGDTYQRDNGQRYDGRDNGQWRSSNRGYRAYGSYDRDAWRNRIRFGLGISIFAGRPFAFHFDYGWRPQFSYYYTMRPGMAYGGMSFLVDPDYAEVYIDGELVGNARDFGGQPVPVATGFHRIELYAPGFEPVAFDVMVRPGQVIPYRGSLYPVY